MKKEDIEIGDEVYHFVREKRGVVIDVLPTFRTKVTISWLSDKTECSVSVKYLELVKKEKEPIQEKEIKQWSFNSLHEKDIDWEELAQDLTKKNPIALVTIGDSKYYVLIHNSIIEKAACLEEDITSIIPVESVKSFSIWIKEVKRIKNTAWPKEGRNKTKISVVLPNI